ncbi:MAG TPA: squalene/phytoene synthase family protein [Candidatus Sulfotelmatobacter sp.]|jgi:phytoene synthase|nr:squalene/phytoene synthase family protein [Candidatus Sulfotelmatobacter sp.]
MSGGRSSSFFLAMRLLGGRRRRAMFALYDFCRAVDDVVDEGDAAPGQRLAELEAWRERVKRLYGRPPETPLAKAVVEFGLPEGDLLAVIDGMAMDAEGLMRRPSAACLELYCDRAAAAVGRLTLRIFGLAGSDMDALASALGSALQRTNILRDLAEDAGRGRLYLPDELLSAYGIASGDPAEVLADPALPAVCAALAALARLNYARAHRLMAARRCRVLRSAGLMAAVYGLQLDRLQAAGWRGTPRLSLFTKLMLAIRWVVLPRPWNDAA